MAYYTPCIPRGEAQLNGSAPALHDFGNDKLGYVGRCLRCDTPLDSFSWNGAIITQMDSEEIETAIDWVFAKPPGHVVMRWLPVLKAAEAFASDPKMRESIWGPSPFRSPALLKNYKEGASMKVPYDIRTPGGYVEAVTIRGAATSPSAQEVQSYLDSMQRATQRQGQQAEEVETPRQLETIDFGGST